MKKIFIILSLVLCEFCYSQDVQKIFLKIDKDILYDKSTLDNTLKEFITIDSQTSFRVYEENDVEKYGTYDTRLRLHQYYGEYRLFPREVLVLIKDNKIVTISGSYYSSIGTIEKTTPLTESEILQIAETEVFASKTDYDFQYEIEKVISKNYFDEDDKNLYYAYAVRVFDNKNIHTDWNVVINETTGEILRKTSNVISEPTVRYAYSLLTKSEIWKEARYGVLTDGEIVCEEEYSLFMGESYEVEEKTFYPIIKASNGVYSELGVFRRNGEKYYFTPKESSEEFLLYDFGLQQGNTVTIYNQHSWKDKKFRDENPELFTHIVEKVDTLVDDDRFARIRKRITLDNGDVWIYGVGSIYGLIYSCNITDGAYTKLLYSEVYGDEIYFCEPDCSCEQNIEYALFNAEINQQWTEVDKFAHKTTYTKGESYVENDVTFVPIIKTEYGESSLQGVFRQDGSKYYFTPDGSDCEYLLYDFGLQVGDKFSSQWFSWGKDYDDYAQFEVIQIDTIVDEVGIKRKQITLNFDTWIEGIGSIYGLLNSLRINNNNALYPTHLCSYTENGYIIYKNYDQPRPLQIIRINENRCLIRYSSDSKDLILTLPTTNNKIKIFDMQGKQVLQTECGETANINVAMLPKGVYTLVVNGAESQKFVKE